MKEGGREGDSSSCCREVRMGCRASTEERREREREGRENRE